MSSDLKGFKAVLYARVSTDDKGQTCETQIREMIKWCNQKEVEIIRKSKDEVAYTDEITGSTLERPGFQGALGRIMLGGVNILLAYDLSRLTRDNKFADIERMIKPFGCQIRTVALDIDFNSYGGQVMVGVQGPTDRNENVIRNGKTKMGIDTRRLKGLNVGRVAVFMIAEDIEFAPKGRCNLDAQNEKYKTVTKVLPENVLYEYARKGYSLSYVAEHLLGVPRTTLYYELKLKDPNDPKCRNKGRIDRYSVYQTLYEQAIGVRKGVCSERVGETGENCS